VFAETWSCSYLFNGKATNSVWVREGKVFYNVTAKAHSKIIFEDNRIISLHNTFSPTYGDYFATLLDKKKNMFAMIKLEVGNHSKLIEGTCEIY
tara:strand:- start:4161 stop:4442 length:282 start_codon:yes stop_codon:yes gene_type:complete